MNDLINGKIIMETSYTKYEDNYAIIYKDKYLDIEEYHDRGNNTISYNFHKNSKYIEQKLEEGQSSSHFTAAYFAYIHNNGTIPMFNTTEDGKFGFYFSMVDGDNENYGMKFVVELAGHEDACSLALDDYGVYIFDKEAMNVDPYNMEKYTIMEIYFTEGRDKLLIRDYDQKEFYAIDIHYHQVLSGKVNNNFKIESYIQDGERYTFKYDKHGELESVETLSGNRAAEIIKYGTEYDYSSSNMVYRIPYILTSYGVIISDNNNALFKEVYRVTNDRDETIETTVKLVSKRDQEKFWELSDKLQEELVGKNQII